MVKNSRKWTELPKMDRKVENGHKNGQKWPKMVKNGQKWSKMAKKAKNGQKMVDFLVKISIFWIFQVKK